MSDVLPPGGPQLPKRDFQAKASGAGKGRRWAETFRPAAQGWLQTRNALLVLTRQGPKAPWPSGRCRHGGHNPPARGGRAAGRWLQPLCLRPRVQTPVPVSGV